MFKRPCAHNNLTSYPPPAEVSHRDGGGYIVGTAPPAYAGQASQSEAARLGNSPYDENYSDINTSTPLIPRQRGTGKTYNARKVDYDKAAS
jgi:hypothetical protein